MVGSVNEKNSVTPLFENSFFNQLQIKCLFISRMVQSRNEFVPKEPTGFLLVEVIQDIVAQINFILQIRHLACTLKVP